MNKTTAQLKAMSAWQKFVYLFSILAMYAFAGLYFLWQAGKLEVLPKLLLVTSFALIPVVVTLIAVYFASKDKSASPNAFKK